MMDNGFRKSYIFTQNQFRVLFSGMGYTKIHGLLLDNDNIDDTILVNTLNELVKLNILVCSDNGFKSSENIRSIINTIGKSDCFVAVRSSNVFLPNLCLYCGEKIVVCEIMKQRSNKIKVSVFSAYECFRMFCDEGYFPAFQKEYKINDKELENFEETITDNSNIYSPISENSRVILDISYVKQNRTTKFLKIINYYLYYYVLYFDGEKYTRYEFTEKNIYGLISKLLEEKDDNN